MKRCRFVDISAKRFKRKYKKIKKVNWKYLTADRVNSYAL